MTGALTNGVRRFYEFGPFRLDPNRHRLLHHGEVIALSPKAIQTLTLLVQNPGKLLEREALMEALWPNTIVEDANLTVAISQLRKALNQHCDTGEFIQTIPRVGYRFAADVREVTEERTPLANENPVAFRTVVQKREAEATGETASQSPPITTSTELESAAATPARRWNRMAIVAAVLILILGAAAYFLYHSRSHNPELALPPTKGKTLAVLPFQVSGSKNPEDEYLAPAVADSLNTRLSRIRQFAVRPTNSVLRFNQPGQNVLEAGRKLAVEGIIEGHIERADDRVQRLRDSGA